MTKTETDCRVVMEITYDDDVWLFPTWKIELFSGDTRVSRRVAKTRWGALRVAKTIIRDYDRGLVWNEW